MSRSLDAILSRPVEFFVNNKNAPVFPTFEGQRTDALIVMKKVFPGGNNLSVSLRLTDWFAMTKWQGYFPFWISFCRLDVPFRAAWATSERSPALPEYI